MPILFYSLAVMALVAGLVVFSYLDRVYRELGRVNPARLRANLAVFEAEVEPGLRLDRHRAPLCFSLLAHLWLVVVAVGTARGVIYFVPTAGEALLELVVFLLLEVLVAMHFIPYLLLTRTTGRWLGPFVPVIRVFALIILPLRGLLELAGSIAHLSEEEPSAAQLQQEGMDALVEAAEEEGILAREQARLIEQVVEFTDKRVHE